MRFDHEAQKKENEAAVGEPAPGDYWHEMFMMVLLVVGRVGDTIFYVDEVDDTGKGRRFKRDQFPKSTTVDALRKRLSYGSIPGYWADVMRGTCSWEVRHFGDKLRESLEAEA